MLKCKWCKKSLKEEALFNTPCSDGLFHEECYSLLCKINGKCKVCNKRSHKEIDNNVYYAFSNIYIYDNSLLGLLRKMFKMKEYIIHSSKFSTFYFTLLTPPWYKKPFSNETKFVHFMDGYHHDIFILGENEINTISVDKTSISLNEYRDMDGYSKIIELNELTFNNFSHLIILLSNFKDIPIEINHKHKFWRAFMKVTPFPLSL